RQTNFTGLAQCLTGRNAHALAERAVLRDALPSVPTRVALGGQRLDHGRTRRVVDEVAKWIAIDVPGLAARRVDRFSAGCDLVGVKDESPLRLCLADRSGLVGDEATD